MAENTSEIEERGIVVTENAARRIAALKTQEQAENAFLRIAVSGGGCSGFQYGLSLRRPAQRRRFSVRARWRHRRRRRCLARLVERRRGRLCRGSDGRLVPDQQPECRLFLRLRQFLLDRLTGPTGRGRENRQLERQFGQGAAAAPARLSRGGATRCGVPAGDEMPGGRFPDARGQGARLPCRDDRAARL